MASSVYEPLFGTPQMDAIWSDDNLVRTWLRTEIAIATALDDLGGLEPGALEDIQRAATADNIDLAQLRLRTRSGGMPIKPLVDQVVAAGGPLTKKYFHWGATTQDILDTSQALRLRDSLVLAEGMMRQVLQRLVRMAEAHRTTPMVARTNAQDALPTTWGLQVSTFASELVRHLERLHELRPRATQGMFGGAVGTLAALGPRGMDVRRRVLALLDLPRPVGAWNGSQDGIAEVIHWSALVQGTLVRLANDVDLMGRTALGELRPTRRAGPSSTMPHKTNPRDANMMQTCFQLAAMYAGQAVHLMDQVDVRSAAKRAASWVVVPGALRTLGAALDRAQALLEGVVVDEARMLASFQHSRGFVMSEAVMYRLSEKIGRDEAYAVVSEAIAAADDDPTQDLLQILVKAPRVSRHLSEAELRQACDPRNYLGSADALVQEVLERARPWCKPVDATE